MKRIRQECYADQKRDQYCNDDRQRPAGRTDNGCAKDRDSIAHSFDTRQCSTTTGERFQQEPGTDGAPGRGGLQTVSG